MPINIGGADDELKGVSFADDINSFLALSIYLSPSLENLVLYTIHMITVKRRKNLYQYLTTGSTTLFSHYLLQLGLADTAPGPVDIAPHSSIMLLQPDQPIGLPTLQALRPLHGNYLPYTICLHASTRHSDIPPVGDMPSQNRY